MLVRDILLEMSLSFRSQSVKKKDIYCYFL